MRIPLFSLPLLLIMALGCEPAAFGPGVQDFSATLPNGYFLYRMSAHQIMVAPQSWSTGTPLIPAKVVELNHDGRFVIARQQVLERRSPENPSDTYEQPKPDSFQYWILDTQKPEVWGPLASKDFHSERSRLGISPELALRDVYDFKP